LTNRRGRRYNDDGYLKNLRFPRPKDAGRERQPDDTKPTRTLAQQTQAAWAIFLARAYQGR